MDELPEGSQIDPREKIHQFMPMSSIQFIDRPVTG
jgi:hypothetical protein